MRRSFIARYSGACVECDGSVEEGLDEIVMTDDGAIHLECDESPGDSRATFPL